jgi:hypothetical protein
MASRQEEKEQRRLERLAQEEAAKKAAARKRALGLIGGIVLAVAAVAAIVLVVSSGGGDSSDEARAGNTAELREAAAAAGCELKTAQSEGRDHVEEDVKAEDYKTNPPASGKHSPVAAQDGFYQPGNEPALGNWIHALEHGRVLLQFKEGAGQDVVTKLRDLANEELEGSAGYHTLVHQNNTAMPYDTAAVAWTRFVGCKGELTDAQLQVMRDFRTAYTDQAPEFIP